MKMNSEEESRVRPRSLSTYKSSEREILVGALAGEGVFLYVPSLSLRIHLGVCEEKETEPRSLILPLGDDTGDDFLIFFGYRHMKKNHSLRIWKWRFGDSEANLIDISRGGGLAAGSFSGFGFAAILRQQPSLTVGFATGLGKGVARLWALDLATSNIKLLGSYKAKHSTLSSLLILPGRFITGTQYACVQEWNIDVEAQLDSPVERGGRDCRVLGKTETRELLSQTFPDFIDDIRFPDLRPDVLAYIKKQSSPVWNELFPLTVIDPLAYDGETDAEGRAHGHGSRLLENGYHFEGEWEHGIPVHGKIIGKNHYVYDGEVRGDNVQPHGFGTEIRNCGAAEIEEYSGGWKDGERHGLGVLSWKNTNPVKSKNHGVKEWGFFRQGKMHGLRVHEWAMNAPELPFAKGMEIAVGCLGAVRCMQMHVDGKFFDEFHFHRADGKPWTKEDRKLLNVVELNKEGPESFAANPRRGELCGRSARLECWACMQEEEDDSNVFSCVGCSMRVHKDCALFEPNFLGKFWLCIMCKEKFVGSKKRQVTAYDRHGELVLIETAEDIIQIMRPDQEPKHRPLKLYSM